MNGLTKFRRELRLQHPDDLLTGGDVVRADYNDAILTATVSQINSLVIVYSTVYSGADLKKTSKLSVTALCVDNSPVTGEFPAQRPVTRKIFPFNDGSCAHMWHTCAGQ